MVRFLAGLELPEHWFHGAGPELVVLPVAGMSQALDGAAGGRELVQVPGPLGSVDAVPAGVLGQLRDQPQPAGAGAGEVLPADVAGARAVRSLGRTPT
jgi:hypothetical protein